MHESIPAYRRRTYLWVAAGLTILCVIAYVLHEPQEPPNGGTWLGYALGTVGVALIIWLMLFGVRKRAYGSGLGTVQGWLSAHVYLGTALLVVVVLHAGFQVGWNVHTLALVLMALVIASGFFGVYAYLKYPDQMSANRAGLSRAQLVEEVGDLDRRMRQTAAGLPGEFAELVASAANRTVLGGSTWAQLSGRDLSQVVLPVPGGGQQLVANARQESALDWLAEQQSRSADADALTRIAELSGLLRTKRQVLARLRTDIRLQALLQIWLYLHVPLSAALLAALVAHIVSVFIYW